VQLDQLFGNGQTQTRSPISPLYTAVSLFKRGKNMLKLIFGDANAGIADADGQVFIL
jgi:hypothetical protein